MRPKDGGHVGDFIVGQYSSCFFSVSDFQSGKNIIEVEIRIITPSEWFKLPFTDLVKLTNPFCDVSGQPYEDKIVQIRSIWLFFLTGAQIMHVKVERRYKKPSTHSEVLARYKERYSSPGSTSRIHRKEPRYKFRCSEHISPAP